MPQIMHEPEHALVQDDGMLAPSNQNAAGKRVAKIMKSGSWMVASVCDVANQLAENALDSVIS